MNMRMANDTLVSSLTWEEIPGARSSSPTTPSMGFYRRGIHDRFTYYFDNNRAQALINQQYCIHNPHHWQDMERTRGALPRWMVRRADVPYEPTFHLDDGTIAPTGAISAFAYTPNRRWPRSNTSTATWALKSGQSMLPRRFQPSEELVFRHNHGPESGANGGHDRKSTKRLGLEELHGQFRDSSLRLKTSDF